MEKNLGPIKVTLMIAGKQPNDDVIPYDVMKQMAVKNATCPVPVYEAVNVDAKIIGFLRVLPNIEEDEMVGFVHLNREHQGKPYVIGQLLPVQLNLPYK